MINPDVPTVQEIQHPQLDLTYRVDTVLRFRIFNPLGIKVNKGGSSEPHALPVFNQRGEMQMKSSAEDTDTPLPEVESVLQTFATEPEKATVLAQVVACTYQELLAHKLIKPEDLPQTQETQWWQDKELVERLAANLQETYTRFCKKTHVQKVTRTAKDGHTFNLAESRYEDLDERWKTNNQNAALYFSMIFSIFDRFNLFDQLDVDEFGMPIAKPYLFLMNASQFTPWSHLPNIPDTVRNPLFQDRPYLNLQEISKGKPPIDEGGWPDLIQKYRLYIEQNQEYFLELLDAFNKDPKDGLLSSEEIKSISDDEMQVIIQMHAEWELNKDLSMMSAAVSFVQQYRATVEGEQKTIQPSFVTQPA